MTTYMSVCVYVCVCMDFLGGSVVKNPPSNTGEGGSTPGLGRSPREGNDSPF